MKKVKIIAGIIWAILCLFLMLIFFPGYNSFSRSASKLPFMKINPNYSGGEIAQKQVMESCTLVIRKPVFDGLLRERSEGFVQLDWRGNIPEVLTDTIDFNLDNNPDFIISINSKSSETALNPINDKVRDVNTSTPTSYGWAVRINLVK